MAPVMTINEIESLLGEVFPQVSRDFKVLTLDDMAVTVRLNVNDTHLRPGGTVSGPSMFGLADVSVYIAVMAMVGPEALAVTTNASIDFMRKPAAGVNLIAECRLLKLGKVLAVGDVLMYSEGDPKPVARASMTYSIPPKRQA